MFKLGIFLALIITSFTCYSQESRSKMFFFVSTMDQDHNRGIALYELDLLTGSISFIKDFEAEPLSDYLTLSNSNNFLYTVVQEAGRESGLVTSFSIDQETGDLKYVDEEFTNGSGPCYVTMDRKGHFLIVAHYDGGSVSTIRAYENGSLGKVAESIYHRGNSVVSDRQEKPHPHMAFAAPRSSFMLIPDLGMDKIMCYRLMLNGKLKPTKQTGLSLPPGSGPRHLVFHPSGNFGFVVNELNSTVTSFSFDKRDGSMELIESIRSIPEDYEEPNYLADVHIFPDGRFLYASNRGHNSISIFKIDQKNGKLELINTTPCGGDRPRAFNISPAGDYLLVANERSDNIVVFQVDRSTGLLTKKDENNDFPAPRCIKFLNK